MTPEPTQVVVENQIGNRYCVSEMGDKVADDAFQVNPAVTMRGSAGCVEHVVDEEGCMGFVDLQLREQRPEHLFLHMPEEK